MLSPTLTVEALFNRWPQTMNVFVRLRFACIGCAMSPFDTLADVARNYGMPLQQLTVELIAAIEESAPNPPPHP
ncbi:MAG: DUF1858 domain-containing protein [Bellilinea sp.]